MNQKSSLREDPQFVSGVLTGNNRKAAEEFASSLRAKLDADLLGQSYSEIARHLNERGMMTRSGRKFFPQTVKNYLRR